MWQRFTERTRRVIFFSQEEAARLGENYVGTEHILLGLVRENDSVAARILDSMGVNLSRVRQEIERQVSRGDGRLGQEMQLTPRAKRVIDLAYEEARTLNNNYIGTEHLLLGLIQESEGIAGRVLARLGVELEETRQRIALLQDGENIFSFSRGKKWYQRPKEPKEPSVQGFTLNAVNEAIIFQQEEIRTEHILLSLLNQGSSIKQLLEQLDVDVEKLIDAIDSQAPRGTTEYPKRLSEEVKQLPQLAGEEAQRTFVMGGPEHMLLGLLRIEEGLAYKILTEADVTLEKARKAVNEIQSRRRVEKEASKLVESAGSQESDRELELNSGGQRQGRRRFPQRSEQDMNVEAAARRIVRTALREDLTPNDLTSELTVPPDAQSIAVAVAKAEGVIAGIEAARQAFLQVDSSVEFVAHVEDGAKVSVGDEVFTAAGLSRSLLAAERTALNLLQHLSGVATQTAQYVAAVEGTKARIIDTRKTTPGLRLLEKYAVRKGGGRNHRYNLSDGILIKDNHIVAAGGIAAAVKGVQEQAPHTLRIEVEVTNEEEIAEALEAGADVLLLDNMTPEQLRSAVTLIAGRALTEASGGITLDTLRAVAESGVDFISVGALTHSVQALDVSLQFRRP